MRPFIRNAVIAAVAAGGGSLGVYQAVNPIFEGREHEAYLDIVDIPTICEGWTHGVKLGDTATDSECDKYSERSYQDAKNIFDKWVPDSVRSQINEVTEASFLLFITNVGSGGKGIKDGFVWLKNGRHSSMLRYLQAGDIKSACGEFNKWANAGGKPIRGLQVRRVDETDMCRWGDD